MDGDSSLNPFCFQGWFESSSARRKCGQTSVLIPFVSRADLNQRGFGMPTSPRVLIPFVSRADLNPARVQITMTSEVLIPFISRADLNRNNGGLRTVRSLNPFYFQGWFESLLTTFSLLKQHDTHNNSKFLKSVREGDSSLIQIKVHPLPEANTFRVRMRHSCRYA